MSETMQSEMGRDQKGKSEMSRTGAGKRHIDLVRQACAYIEERDGERVTLAELAEEVDASPWHLQRLFRRVMGVSPRDYADARRAENFRSRLKAGDSIAGATYGAGYGSSSRVYEAVGQRLGMTPASYAKGGKGARIAYSIEDSPLGRLLVAATEKGICFISIADSDDTLVDALEQEFPAADELKRDDTLIASALRALVAFLDGETPHIDLPLDVRATAFQRRVWQELITIPVGEVRTYSEIAEAVGLPKGQRAVARACAMNPVALVVPCHRVVREDGGLSGYRWGLDRRRKLLRQEAGQA